MRIETASMTTPKRCGAPPLDGWAAPATSLAPFDCILSEDASWVTGQLLSVDGGISPRGESDLDVARQEAPPLTFADDPPADPRGIP